MEQYFVNQIFSTETTTIEDTEIFKHVITVLRHKVSDKIYLVDELKGLYLATIEKIDKDNKTITFKLLKSDKSSTELPVKVTVACSLSKKDKIEWITQKSTELGAAEIVFFNSQYSIMHWKENVIEKKLDRLQEIAKNAAQQAKRRIIPQVSYLNDLKKLADDESKLKFVAYEESAKQGESSLLVQSLDQSSAKSVIGVFGPEGGFSPEEVDFLQDNDYLSVGLGPRIMRAETAPLYFLSVLSYNYELSSK
ncbi:RsmE family RNA methyltransferase [Companilactobacillus keshanensis]|uniref:Ribosomal RNA small subunit methyltransferase E n=1 Tax=Companilactobacillus keshanensis TaxID=2486003 RepID=A0ABW4BT64_9LACO|nr:16S rRNA (uracil(1498)-N(3))-methyltransferase [Companilactobacillus keshanensis]